MENTLFDTHFHLTPETDFPALLAASRAVGVGHFLLAGTSREDIPHYAQLARENEGVVYAAGQHPHDSANFTADDLALIRSCLAQDAVAVGEIGLDYHYNFSPAEDQERVFAQMLELAVEFGKPAQIHCREAFDRCYDLVKTHLTNGQPFIIHSFADGPAEAEKWLELGAYLSFNGMVTFRKADNIRQALPLVPRDRLLIETDSPYLAPIPHRGETNTPAFLPLIAAKIAEERGWDLADTISLTTANASRLLFHHTP
jgi:TatD DNase family protein